MRKFAIALVAAFTLGGFSSGALAHCSYHEKAAKKNDVETPQPPGSGEKKKTQ